MDHTELPDKKRGSIFIHKSLDESEEIQIAYSRSLTPEQRMDEFYRLMKRFYPLNGIDWKSCEIVIDTNYSITKDQSDGTTNCKEKKKK